MTNPDEVILLPKKKRGRPIKYPNDIERKIAHKYQMANWHNKMIKVKRDEYKLLVEEVEDLRRGIKTKDEIIKMMLNHIGGSQGASHLASHLASHSVDQQ